MVDGNDVLAVYEVTKEAVARARAGSGPTMIECKTMRMLGHAVHDNANYVPDELLAEWKQKDPILCYERKLTDQGILTPEKKQAIETRVSDELEEAQALAEQSPLPDPCDLERGVYHEPECYWTHSLTGLPGSKQ
jgi:pyruvate dehydrogenase E1 component alpha subunit